MIPLNNIHFFKEGDKIFGNMKSANTLEEYNTPKLPTTRFSFKRAIQYLEPLSFKEPGFFKDSKGEPSVSIESSSSRIIPKTSMPPNYKTRSDDKEESKTEVATPSPPVKLPNADMSDLNISQNNQLNIDVHAEYKN